MVPRGTTQITQIFSSLLPAVSYTHTELQGASDPPSASHCQ